MQLLFFVIETNEQMLIPSMRACFTPSTEWVFHREATEAKKALPAIFIKFPILLIRSSLLANYFHNCNQSKS